MVDGEGACQVGEWRVPSGMCPFASVGLITVSKRTGAGAQRPLPPTVVINLAKLLFSLGFYTAEGAGQRRMP